MRIEEDKADRERLFRRLTEERFTVRAKQYEPARKSGWPRKHQLTPCVRRGAGEVWLVTRSHDAETEASVRPRGRALNFLRGHSHEALVTEGQSLVFVYEGVGNEVDEWTGEPEAPFTEIKSTTASSVRMLEIVKRREIDILNPLEDTYFSAWFAQCGQNCVATGVTRCRLRVFFTNGEYGARRTKCPECASKLGDLRDVYRECGKCGYKSYSVDLRSYILTFSQKELRHFDKEVFHVRRDQYHAALETTAVKAFLKAAPGTPCYACQECGVGKAVGCEFLRRREVEGGTK